MDERLILCGCKARRSCHHLEVDIEGLPVVKTYERA